MCEDALCVCADALCMCVCVETLSTRPSLCVCMHVWYLFTLFMLACISLHAVCVCVCMLRVCVCVCEQDTIDSNWDFFGTALKSHYNSSAVYSEQIAEATAYVKTNMEYCLYVNTFTIVCACVCVRALSGT